MANGGRIPGPYVNQASVDNGLCEYVPFDTLDIGARRSGMPGKASMGPKSIEHVGGSQGSRGMEPSSGRTAGRIK